MSATTAEPEPWVDDPYALALRTGRGPLFLRRSDGWLLPLEVERWCVLGAALAVGLAYLPYVLASGAGVLGYLPGYLHEEGYASGDVRRFALLRLLLPGRAAGPAVVLLIAATALYVWRRGDCARPWRGALLVTGTALLLTSPAYPWYALLVVALVALDGRWEWLAIPAAGAALYVGGVQQSVSYGAAGLVVLGGTLIRRTWSRKGNGPRLYVHKRESPREDLPV